jgi:hypothetical protein
MHRKVASLMLFNWGNRLNAPTHHEPMAPDAQLKLGAFLRPVSLHTGA